MTPVLAVVALVRRHPFPFLGAFAALVVAGAAVTSHYRHAPELVRDELRQAATTDTHATATVDVHQAAAELATTAAEREALAHEHETTVTVRRYRPSGKLATVTTTRQRDRAEASHATAASSTSSTSSTETQAAAVVERHQVDEVVARHESGPAAFREAPRLRISAGVGVALRPLDLSPVVDATAELRATGPLWLWARYSGAPLDIVNGRAVWAGGVRVVGEW